MITNLNIVKKFHKAPLVEALKKVENPGTGWYHLYTFDATCADPVLYVAYEEEEIVLLLIDIGGFRGKELSTEALLSIRQIFYFFKEKKKDMIVRFAYDTEGKGMEKEPESGRIVLEHIRQLGTVIREYQSWILVVQGLLVGSWGEMHDSKYLTKKWLIRLAEEMLKANGKSFKDQTVVISGSGNVAIYATKKATEFGAKVVALSDSNGYIYDPDGIDLPVVQQIKEVERGRIKEYVDRTSHKNATYTEGCSGIWSIKCDIALPCATQNEIDADSAKKLAANGCYAVSEGANMPSTPEAIDVYFENKMLYGPAKAANAGGVATSGLEMSQNSERLSWTFEEVDAKLHGIMKEIFKSCDEAAKEFGMEGNYMAGANIAGFLKVAEAMKAQGCV